MTIAIAFILAALILAGTVWAIRFIATGPPPKPDPEDIVEVDVPYVCAVCGMSLTITEAAHEDVAPPRHCMEEMVRA